MLNIFCFPSHLIASHLLHFFVLLCCRIPCLSSSWSFFFLFIHVDKIRISVTNFFFSFQRSVLLNIILHIYESYSMNFYLKGSLLFSERHYRVNSEEEERDISAKGRRGEKKQTKGVARSRGWVIDGRQSVRSWTRRKLIRVGRKFN